MAKRITPEQAQASVVKAGKMPVVKPAIKRVTKSAASIEWAIPDVYVDSKRNTYICIGSQIGIDAYITSRLGYITIEYHGSGMPELKPTRYEKPFKLAIKPYTKAGGNVLDVSSLAQQVIDAIEANDDPARDDFISTVVKANKAANKPTPSSAKPKAKSGVGKAQRAGPMTGFVTLKQLLDEFKLDGKLVRGKLRAHYTKPVEGWVWLEKEAEAIRAEMRKWFKIKAAA